MLSVNKHKQTFANYRSLWTWIWNDLWKVVKMQKLKRNIGSGILDRFWVLVDVSDKKRLNAAEQLLSALSLKQPPVTIFIHRKSADTSILICSVEQLFFVRLCGKICWINLLELDFPELLESSSYWSWHVFQRRRTVKEMTTELVD